MRATYLLTLVATLLLHQMAGAACMLPVPDGGNAQPSNANLQGRIASVSPNGHVVVSQAKSGKRIVVVLPPKAEIYSAFGGDVPQEELASGQTVWVWFKGCEWPATGAPISAYFQIYSKDPHDRP